MELIVIDDKKLKIMLTAPDMKHYDLHAEEIEAASADTRRAFRHIFDDARSRIGFETEGERLFVQLYTSRGGGCEIFVTKLGPAEPAEPTTELHSGEDALLDRLRAVGYTAEEESMSASINRPDRPTETVAYRFDGLSSLLAVCRRLRRDAAENRVSDSAVYIDERAGREQWYLILRLPVAEYGALAFPEEYAERVLHTVPLELYLSEHARVICTSSAVETLGDL